MEVGSGGRREAWRVKRGDEPVPRRHSAWGGGDREEPGLPLVCGIWVKSSDRGRLHYGLKSCVSPIKFIR